MLTVWPTSHADFDRMMELLAWCAELQPDYLPHSAFLVASQTLPQERVTELIEALRHCNFKSISAIKLNQEITTGWPKAPGLMFRTAADHIAERQQTPFLWIEADEVPMKPGWLDAIDNEYRVMGKPFLGSIYPKPFPHVNGGCVYPAFVRKFNPYVFQPNHYELPWDLVRPDVTLRLTHATELIVRSLERPEKNEPWTFPDDESIQRIVPERCVLFHGCKDGTLIARLRERRDAVSPPEESVSLGARIVDGVKRFLATGNDTFYHSGNLGDVIYALYAMKAAGGGELVIGPEQWKTAICTVPVDKRQFEMLLPLFKEQAYIQSATFSLRRPHGVVDLNHFRNHWNNSHTKTKHGIDTLCKAHFHELGILNKFKDDEAWLTCSRPVATGKIIIHRSPRYNAPVTGEGSFPWQSLVERHQSEMLFVGLEHEWESFCRAFKCKVSFWKVKDFMEMAALIAGGRVFIGNQSFPLALAIGLNVKVICEACPRSPDCRFIRDNYTDQLLAKIDDEDLA